MQILNALLGITVFSTIIFCVTMIVKTIFKSRMSPFLHYAIWSIFLLRLLLPVTFSSPVRFLTLPPTQEQGLQSLSLSQPSELPAAPIEAQSADGAVASEAAGFSAQAGQTAPTQAAWFSVRTLPTAKLASWLLIIWLFGVGIGLGYLLFLYIRLRKRIAQDALPPAKRLCSIYRQVKRELRIRARVPLVCLRGRDSPGLLLPACVLMPTETLAVMDDAQMKQILTHELMHYKRKDQIACILLSALCAVYWFDPVVWLAARQIRADMETACDSAVVKNMTLDEKSGYATLILELFSRSRYRQVILGMAHGRAKSIAEQRIRGVFMNMKSRWSARLVCGLLSLAMLAGCFTTACVPKPNNAADIGIIGGADGPTEIHISDHDATDANPAPDSQPSPPLSPLVRTLEIPVPWIFAQKSSDGELLVCAELEVTLPDVDTVPTASAVIREVTEDDLLRVATAFFGPNGTFTYALQDTREYALDYIERDRELYESVINGTCENKVPSFQKSVKEQYEAYLAQAETAPSRFERRALEPVFTEHVDVSGDAYFGFRGVATHNGTEYLVSAANTQRASAIIIAEVYKDYSQHYFGTYRREPEGVSVTKAEAAAIAGAMAAQIDDGLALSHVMTVGLPVDYGAENHWEHPWAWQCVFMRQVNGVGTAYDSRGVGSDMESNVVGRAYEALEITVDDRGVCNIRWINPMHVTEVTNAATPLLSFETIWGKLPDQLREKYDYDITQNELHTVYLRHVELGLMRVGKPGSTVYTLEPVWNFFADFEESPDYSNPDLQRAATTGDPVYWNSLTISAIDGRLIDRDYGA